MGELVVQHAAHNLNGLLVPGIGIPTRKRVDELPEDACRIPLPVGSLKSRIVEDGVDEVYLQARLVAAVDRNFVLDKVPRQLDHLFVAQVFLRLIPGQQLAPLVEHRLVPR